MLKVMTIVGTRPELIKMSRVISIFDQHTEHIFVHTGQNYDYELNGIFFEDLGLREPDFFLAAATDTSYGTVAEVIRRAGDLLTKERPDALLLYGDTNSCLSVIPAKRLKIPVFHMEAGNRCFDQRVPEELNRRVIDHLSDINLVLTEHARRYLLAEGIRPETVIKTGSHLLEVLTYHWNKIENSKVLEWLGVASQQFFLVSAHREENVDDPLKIRELLIVLGKLAEAYKLPIIVSTHPRTRKRLEGFDINKLDPLIQFMEPFSFTDYVHLQKNALCVLSDSGTITEEADLLGLSAVMLRDAHERPEGMDVGSVIMAALNSMAILDAVRLVLAIRANAKVKFRRITDYQNTCVSEQILKIVYSYVDYVNRTVWSKGIDR
jgi:UDP-N-acetylglucosamine 2-epimerase (non-hydrolysing)